MNLLAYLIRTALCLIFFYITYRVLLYHKCCYTANRFYLIGSFLLSFIFPLITIDLALIRIPLLPAVGNSLPGKTDALYAADRLITTDQTVDGIHHGISFSLLFSVLYFSGILLFLIRYSLDLIRLIRMIKNNIKKEFNHYTLVKLKYPVAPFSFFRYVFVYDRDVESDEFRLFIITHEQAHIRNWHSLDSIFLGMGQIIQWFNPVVLLYKKAVIAMHEFSADREVIDQTESLTGYQQKILKYAYMKNNIMFTSNLSNTMIKKRFIMMTKQNQGRHNPFRIIASAVIAAFLLLAFSNGDKTGVKPLHDSIDPVFSLPQTDDNSFYAASPVGDTLRHSDAEQSDNSGIQANENEEEVRILHGELDRVKQPDPHDSLSPLTHAEFFMNPENFARQMAEMQSQFAERQLRNAQRQLRMAEEQQMLAERLRPLLNNHPAFQDTEVLRKMAEAQARMEHIRPLIGKHSGQEHISPMIGDPLLFPPLIPPFHFDGDPADLPDIQARIEEELKDLEDRHFGEPERLKSLEEMDLKMLQEQLEWQDKYHREMEKQRDQMEKTRRQFMDEYLKMMHKHRKEVD